MVRRTSKSHWPPIVIIHLCARKMLITQFGSHVAIHYFAKYAWEKRLSRESCTWFFKILNWQDKHPRQRYMMLFKHRGGKSFEYRFTAFCDRAFVYNSFFFVFVLAAVMAAVPFSSCRVAFKFRPTSRFYLDDIDNCRSGFPFNGETRWQYFFRSYCRSQ